MQLFGRSGGFYLFWCSAVYLTLGLLSIYLKLDITPQIQVAWISALLAPFVIPTWGRWLNMDVTWDRKMFNKWFGKKEEEESSNVVPFPELKEVPKVAPPPEEEKPAKIFYRLGVTDNNRVSFSMGYSEITMTKQGVQNMIEQLAVFRDQLTDDTEE